MKRKFPSSDDNNDQRSRKRQRLNNNNNNNNNTNNNYNNYNNNNNNNSNNNNYFNYSTSPTPSSTLSSSSSSIKPNFSEDLLRISRPEINDDDDIKMNNNNNNNNNNEIRFQHVDTDYYIGFAPNENGNQRNSNRNSRAIIRLYGVTSSGKSVLAHVVGFCPYFYVQTWDGFRQNNDEELFRNSLNNLMLRNSNTKYKVQGDYIIKVITVQKQSIWGYHFNKKSLFLKVYTALPTLISSARRLVTDGITINNNRYNGLQTYESSLLFILRFMIDRNIVGAGWISVNNYKLINNISKSSHSTIELVSRWDSINTIRTEESIAPLRILSFDIECMCSEGFPDPKKNNDSVIQISNVCYIQGTKEKLLNKNASGDKSINEDELYYHKNVFCLKSCAPIAGCSVYSFNTEKELLMSWKSFVLHLDPDILTGYNINNFDLPYLINRAEYLRLSNFPYLGRIKHMKTTMKDSQFSSRAYGTTRNKDISIPGRIQMDLLPIIRRDHKLRSYSLNSVSFHFLKSQKEDVHYSIIGDLQNGTEQTRRRLAVYCLKDSILPIKLINKLQISINLIEMARVTGVPINFLIKRGQQIKVLSQLYRAAALKNLIVPYKPYNRDENNSKNNSTDAGYEGATVIEPVRGYYKTPITTLDFASLYPSIMIAHNLCYTTLIDSSDLNQISDSNNYTKTDSGDCFIKPSISKGLLPEILEDLLSARKKVKKLMKELKKQVGGKDSMQYAVYNGRQLALKISANSVYGFTGATVGALPCLKISAAVTSFGRDMIHQTKEFIEKHYCKSKGFFADSQVVYGDTDSVMIKFGDNDHSISIEDAMKYGNEAAQLVTDQLFINPIRLEFEKVYLPYLLMNKKRYAGMLWTNCVKWDYMDAKGIETVRRDCCPLTKNVVQNVLNYILIDGNQNSAVEYAKNIIYKLLQNKIDMSSLIITKSLNKISEYKVRAAHVELAIRMKKRGDKIYKSGDRVAYVICKGSKKAKAYEKAEDPLYALQNNISLDTEYYVNNQLKLPLTRIFEPILGPNGINKLFRGSHTKCIKIATSNIGAMMSFVVKQKTCIGCKCILKKSEKKNNICGNCKKNESKLYIKNINIVKKKEILFHKLWTQCQRCQGSLTQQVLCSNRDCQIFYKRTKVRKELQEAQKLLKDFSF